MVVGQVYFELAGRRSRSSQRNSFLREVSVQEASTVLAKKKKAALIIAILAGRGMLQRAAIEAAFTGALTIQVCVIRLGLHTTSRVSRAVLA